VSHVAFFFVARSLFCFSPVSSTPTVSAVEPNYAIPRFADYPANEFAMKVSDSIDQRAGAGFSRLTFMLLMSLVKIPPSAFLPPASRPSASVLICVLGCLFVRSVGPHDNDDSTR
jgi:hypothetical protein